ncbi:hypothetical protein ENBRE01_1989 [Enteropsectra breve]|nr:hypothetical protein ENBRE01_1989 [Enteropsectra breve]
MVERNPQRTLIIMPVEKRDEITLLSKLLSYNSLAAAIYSDEWKAYRNLKHYFRRHLVVNHSQNFVDPLTGAHTNTIEGQRSQVKASIPIRYRVQKYIKPYLLRYMLRHNSPGEELKILIKYIF